MRWTSSDGRAWAEITTMPGCPAICIFHAAFVAEGVRHKGIGTRAHHERLLAARAMGYQMAICTIDKANGHQYKILNKFKWQVGNISYNPATGHGISIMMRDLYNIPPLTKSKPDSASEAGSC